MFAQTRTEKGAPKIYRRVLSPGVLSSLLFLLFEFFDVLFSRNAFARLIADRAAGLAGGLTGASALTASGYLSFGGFGNGSDHDKNPPDNECYCVRRRNKNPSSRPRQARPLCSAYFVRGRKSRFTLRVG